MCLHQQLGLKDFSPKVRTLWHCSMIDERGALPMIDRGDIHKGNRTVAVLSGLHCWALVMAVRAQLTARLWHQRSERRSERFTLRQSHREIISALAICIIVCLSWAVNHYRDNAALPIKPSATKMPGELKLANAALSTCRCVSVMLLRSM